MIQRFQKTRWQRLVNNVLSRPEAVMWAVVLLGIGLAVGLLV